MRVTQHENQYNDYEQGFHHAAHSETDQRTFCPLNGKVTICNIVGNFHMHSLHPDYLKAPSSLDGFDEAVSNMMQTVAAPVTSVTMVVMVTGFHKLR